MDTNVTNKTWNPPMAIEKSSLPLQHAGKSTTCTIDNTRTLKHHYKVHPKHQFYIFQATTKGDNLPRNDI